MTVVFVHGACVRDGEWWWSRVAAALRADGMDSVAVRLPSCGEVPGAAADFAADVAETRRVLREVGPAVLVGHSYGGVVATEAAGAPKTGEPAETVGRSEAVGDVRHLVYVSSFLPDVGQSLADLGPGEPAPYLDFSPDGTFGVRRDSVRELFLQDCDEQAVEGAVARLTRQAAAVLTAPVQHAGWRHRPSTAIVCAEDRATPPALQRAQAARATRVVELPTGHHPMLSHPHLLAAALRDVAPRPHQP
ncbi:alpha/beta hydrolase [Micromonospora sp. NPDC049274]|uniref:alpha/beta hydrolase n=1 Tax=Micromonospora sp. NPDC049274 TaxID=3154829 RepID=UPI00343E6738